MVLFDANIILRYILNDNAEMADTAEKYLMSGTGYVTVEVIAEVIYVMKKVYSIDKTVAADIIIKLLELVGCRDMDLLLSGLETYKSHNLDFVDCLLYAWHKIRGADIATFDKKLLKLIEEN